MMIKHIWDYFTDNFSWIPIHPQYFLKKYNQTAVLLAKKYATGTLVDIGCGRMPYREVLLKKVDKYIGIDHPDTAKLYHGKIKPDIFADASKVPLKNNYCDTILLLQVLEHLPEPSEALTEISRILKPNGYLILSTVQSYPIHDEPYDFYRFTQYGLKYLLARNGFKIIKHVEEGNVFILMFQSLNVYLMLILKNLIKTSTGKILALIVFPLFIIITFVSNILSFCLAFVDKNSKFSIIQTMVAIKQK